MILTNLITEALNINRHVTVFTQDYDAVLEFLNNEPGRWTVEVNVSWWGENLKHHVNDKWSIVDSGADIGLDCAGGRLTITKNPFRPIANNSFVIKDFFLFPHVQEADIYPPMTFISHHKQENSIAIIPSDRKSYHDLHDSLTMSEIPHSMDEAGALSVFHNIRYLHGYDMVVTYRPPIIPLLMPLHDCGEIYIVGRRSVLPKWEHCESVMKSLSQTPMSGQTFEFMAYQTLMHPRTLRDTLWFACLMGCAKEVYPDNDVVIIEKHGKPPDELEFHAIPVGTWHVRQLLTHLKIDRAELFPLLKKYEGNGLIFSYAPSTAGTLWTIREPLERHKYVDTINVLAQNSAWLGEIKTNPTFFINTHIEKLAERHAKTYGMKAVFHKKNEVEIIDPTSRPIGTVS